MHFLPFAVCAGDMGWGWGQDGGTLLAFATILNMACWQHDAGASDMTELLA
jgi:hypothetical protein